MTLPEPNYTQAPNVLFDALPKIKSLAELKVTLVIVREVIGYHREETRDPLTVAELRVRTGLSKTAVLAGLQSAMERGTVERRIEGKGGAREAFYSLNFVGTDSVPTPAAGRSTSLTNVGTESEPTLGTRAQETAGKKEERKTPQPPEGEQLAKWGQVIEDLRSVVVETTHHFYFEPLALREVRDGVVLVDAPEHTVAWVREWLPTIDAAVGRIFGPYTVEIAETELERKRREKQHVADTRQQRRARRADEEAS